jgi:hypothetical protein
VKDCPIAVTLSEAEIDRAAGVGRRRQLASVGRRNNHGYVGDGEDINFHGALAELAFCKASKYEWNESVNTFKAADVGKDIQIRCAPSKIAYLVNSWFGNLFVRKGDDPKERYVCVASAPPVLIIKGWLYGHEAMRPEYLTKIGERVTSWLVPCAELRRDFETLCLNGPPPRSPGCHCGRFAFNVIGWGKDIRFVCREHRGY